MLQLFKIMDRLWTEDGLKMEMVTLSFLTMHTIVVVLVGLKEIQFQI